MKRYINFFVIAIAAIFIVSCYEDEGNYDYEDIEKITIEGLAESYTVRLGVDELNVPIIVSSNEEGEMEYQWEIYEPTPDAQNPVHDTISYEKDLLVTINVSPKEYVLVLNVKNKLTGYTEIITSALKVVTTYTQGWYILKTTGETSDLDFWGTESADSYMPTSDVHVEDVLRQINGVSLKGVGRQVRVNTSIGMYLNGGWIKYNNTITALTDKDIAIVSTSDLIIAKDPDNICYEKPGVIAPRFLLRVAYCYWFNNNGKIHVLNASSGNQGTFAGAQPIDEMDSPYSMSKYGGIWSYGSVLYDELSCYFYKLDMYGKSCVKLTRDVTNNFPRENLSCLYLNKPGSSSGKPYYLYGVFEDRTTGKREIVQINLLNSYYDSASIADLVYKLDDTSVASKASLFTIAKNEDYMYMLGEDGNVWSKNLKNGEEKMEVNTNGEKVTYIKEQYLNINEYYIANHKFTYLAVATTAGSGEYTVRLYEKSAGSVTSQEPVMTFTGTGEVKDMTYLSGVNNKNVSVVDSNWAGY